MNIKSSKPTIKICVFLTCCFGFWAMGCGLLCAEEDMRIISLVPAATEILFALGLDEEIAGVTTYCNYPAKALQKEKIGSFSQPNIEKLIKLKPTLVIATGQEQEIFFNELKKLDIRIIKVFPKNFDELFIDIEEIGRLTNRNKQAQKLITLMQNKLDAISKNFRDIPQVQRPSVYLEIWSDPITTAGGSSFVNNLILQAGGKNIAQNLQNTYPGISPEFIIKSNPDCIILAHGAGAKNNNLPKRIGFSCINAVKNNRVYADINPDIILRPGPRAVDGVFEIYKVLSLLSK